MKRITSFKSFSELKKQESAMKLREKNVAKRNELINSIGVTLEELGITSLTELSEEERIKFISRLFNEDRTEEIEQDGIDMGEPDDAEDGEDLEANEGNAFIYAAAKAKQEGKEEFEFNGKKYKVTLKKDTGLKESYTILITEATRSQIGKIDRSGNIISVYVHSDGYPDNMVPLLTKYDANGISQLIKLGASGISSLQPEIGKKHDFNKPTKGWTIFYGRDRGENNDATSKGNVKNIKSYLRNVGNRAGAEFVYLYDERDGKWYGANVYTDSTLKPIEAVEESVSESKGRDLASTLIKNARSSMKKLSDDDVEEFRKEIALAFDLKEKNIIESHINEAEVKSDDEFKKYAFTVLKKAFGDEFDEAKAQKIVDGILSKVDGDYGAAIGMLTSSLG